MHKSKEQNANLKKFTTTKEKEMKLHGLANARGHAVSMKWAWASVIKHRGDGV